MSGNILIKGTLLLTASGFLSRFMGFFYRIFLSHTIGAAGMGIFQLIMPLQALVMAVCASGIQTAISRLCASFTALGKPDRARDFFFTGTCFSMAAASILSFILFKRADFFACEILGEPLTEPLIRIVSLSIPLSALHSCVNGFCFGLKKTGFPAGAQLLEQIVRIGGCFLLYTILSSEGKPISPVIAAGGVLASEAAACIVSLFFICFDFSKNKYSPKKLRQPRRLVRGLSGIAVPLSLNKILLTLLGGIEVVLIPRQLEVSGLSPSDALGIYGVFTGMALPLILFPSTITNSVSAMLMPSVAELHAKKNTERIQQITGKILGFGLLLGSFCALFFYIGGPFLGNLLFHSPTAGTYIRTMSLICPFLYLNTTLTSIINGLGRSGLCLLHSIVSICVRISFVVFVIPARGIQGYLCGILLAELILTLLQCRFLFSFLRKAGSK